VELYVSYSLCLHGLHRNSAAYTLIQKRSEAVEFTTFQLNCTVTSTPSAGFLMDLCDVNKNDCVFDVL